MAERIGLEAILETDQFQKGLKVYTSGLDRMQKETSGFDGKLAAFGKQGIASFQNLGKVALGAGVAIASAGVAAGAAIGAFAIGGIKKAADLEAQLSAVAATLNTTRENIAPLKDLIMDLALDPNLVVSTTEAAEAVENLARNGLSMQQILDGAARSVVLLANATGADFGMAADIATDVMAQFNIEAENMGHAVDQITAVTNLSKFTIDDYALAIAQAGGVASSVGVSFEDFNTTITAISPLFASGSDAGTSFKTLLTAMNPKSKEAAALMKELGINFFDANGQMKDMSVVAEELNQVLFQEVTFTKQVNNMTAEQIAQKKMLENQVARTNMELYKYEIGLNGVAQSEEDKAVSIDRLNRQHEAAMGAYSGLATSVGTTVTITRNLTEAERMNTVQTIAGTDAMRAMLGLAEAGAVIYTDAALAAKELGVSQEEVNKVIEGGVTQFEALQMQMAQIDAAEQAAERMRNFKGVLNIVQGAIEALQIIIGDAFLPILTALGQRFNDLISTIGPSAIKPFQDLGAALTNMFAAIDAGKAPLDIFMAFMIGFGPQGVAVASSMSGIALAVGGIVLAVGMVLQPITDVIGKFVEWQDVAIVLGVAIATVVVPAIYGMIAAMSPIILIIGGAILAVAALRTAWENDWLGIQTKTTEAVSAIQTAFEPFTTAVQTHMQGALAEVKAFATGNETEFTHLNAIWEGLKTSVEGIFSSIVEIVSSKLPEWTGKLQEWGTAAGEWLITAAAEASTKLGEWYASLSGALADKLPTWTTAFSEWSVAAGQWLTDASATIGAKLGEWYTALSGALADKLPAWTAAFEDWITAAWEWIQEASAETAAQIGTWYTELSGAVAAKLPAWKKSFDDWIKGLYEWIKESLPKVTTEIGAWYTKLSGDVAAKLPTFAVEMLKWATALVTWISDKAADALPHLGTWLGKIVAWIPTGIVLLAAGMLKMATALVTWIGSSAADALPHLGTWMGKIVAWIPLGVAALVVGVVKLASALIGWINGGGGVQVSSSATGQVSTEFGKFTTALGNGLTAVWNGFKGFVQNFAQSFWDEIGKHVDWTQLGMDIVGFIQSGVETVSATLTLKFQEIAKQAYDFVINTDWLGLGSTVLSTIKSGVESVASTLISYFGTVAQNAIDKFLGFNWAGLGKDVISGILQGLKDNGSAIVDYIVGLGSQALDQIKAFFGIKSPSTVMMEVGYDIVRGLIKGIDEQQNRLRSAVGRMTNNVMQTLISSGERATDVFAGLAGSFSSIGGGWADSLKATIDDFTQRIDAMSKWTKLPIADLTRYANERTRLEASVRGYESQKRTLDALKQQADLINLIRESGGNPSEVLAGVKFGVDANPQQMLEIVTRTMSVLNARLRTSVMTAASALPEYVEKLRSSRKSAEEIEAQFIATHLDQREFYAKNLAKIDTQIAELEQTLLATGNASIKPFIEGLDADRRRITQALQTYLGQAKQLQEVFATLRNLTGPGQDSAQRFVDEQIQPILDAFSKPMQAQEREAWLRTMAERVAMVNRFVGQMRSVELLQRRIEGNKAFDHLADEFATLTDILTPEGTRTSLLNTLSGYITQMQRLFAIQQDLTVGLQASPFVERFKNEKLDAIEQQLQNINLSEAERGRLIEAYRMEQEKILAIQQKQSQLDFLKQQLDLLNQVKDLDDKFGDLVPVADIFAGVQFGVNASLDSLLGAVSKAIDAMIRVTNKELGIASPSKVFEKIGQYMMGGLARGIETSVMRPINSLSGAISELPYALGGRSLTLNMGGVSISNGMDEVLFEARVRQILDRAFP